jgi:hypothetical protein
MESKIEEALQFVYAYAKHVDDFIVVKKELLKFLGSEYRELFSTRHPLTKKQQPNDLERKIARRWSELTGRDCYI